MRLVLTPGDPLGVGPELTATLLKAETPEAQAALKGVSALHIVGHCETIAGFFGGALPKKAGRTTLHWHDLAGAPGWTEAGTAEAGRIAASAIDTAVGLIAAQKADALVTGPIAKAHLQAARLALQGHTELLETLANRLWPPPPEAPGYETDMLFVYEHFRLLLLTRHIPLNAVSMALTPRRVEAAMLSLIRHLAASSAKTPRLGVLACNPHAGEIGGTEERDVLLPVIRQLRHDTGCQISDPLPADAAFRGFLPLLKAGTLPYDAYIACYHDQGLIPFKLVAGYEAVNVTIGLPFVRTSVSHGTAFDIAGKGLATPVSLYAAMREAVRLLK